MIYVYVVASEVEIPTTSPALPPTGPEMTFTFSDKRSSNLLLRVSTVETFIEDIQAQLFLCKQDTKSLSSGKGRYRNYHLQTGHV